MLAAIRQHLGWKLFLSYLVVILVIIGVLTSAIELHVPTAFNRHMAAMAEAMGHEAPALEQDFLVNFRRAVTEVLLLAVPAALLAALLLSLVVSRLVTLPVRDMMLASQRIAEGHYDERVVIPWDVNDQELDELARLALSFNRMAANLEQTESMRSELIGNVAHELRTPLSSIKGYMEGLIDGVLPAEPATFQQIYREADRLQRLVMDLQELSRVESRAYSLDLRPVPVGNLFAAVTDRLERQFVEKDVALKVDVPAGLPPVLADEDRIGQVLLNLVGNALQYTPTGGQVDLRAAGEDGMVRLSVEDSGVGIAPEHLAHLFERFYRVDKSRSRACGGSGIGLTIANHLVRAHGGELRASSAGLGRGSTFSFTLPVA